VLQLDLHGILMVMRSFVVLMTLFGLVMLVGVIVRRLVAVPHVVMDLVLVMLILVVSLQDHQKLSVSTFLVVVQCVETAGGDDNLVKIVNFLHFVDEMEVSAFVLQTSSVPCFDVISSLNGVFVAGEELGSIVIAFRQAVDVLALHARGHVVQFGLNSFAHCSFVRHVLRFEGTVQHF